MLEWNSETLHIWLASESRLGFIFASHRRILLRLSVAADTQSKPNPNMDEVRSVIPAKYPTGHLVELHVEGPVEVP